jgi:hypothetical protein
MQIYMIYFFSIHSQILTPSPTPHSHPQNLSRVEDWGMGIEEGDEKSLQRQKKKKTKQKT